MGHVVCWGQEIHGNLILSAQFFSKPNTILKNKILFFERKKKTGLHKVKTEGEISHLFSSEY